jgi:FkbM family methyltransferase
MNRTDPALPRSMGTWARRELLHLVALTGQMWRVNFTVGATVAGRPVRIPIVFGQGPQNLALLEPGVFGAFERLLALRPGPVFDVGMNVGQTLLKIKVLDPARPYVGFDTNPRCCQYVDELVAVNGFADCTIIPAGLSDRNGLASLWLRRNVSLDPSATTVDSVCDTPETLRRQQTVVCRGDEVAAALNVEAPAIVKIDTEGGELEVLRGLASTIEHSRPFIICEILPVGDLNIPAGRTRLTRQEAVQALLRATGYQVFRLFADASITRVEDVGVHDDLSLTNYLFVPGEQSDRIARTFSVRTPRD